MLHRLENPTYPVVSLAMIKTHLRLNHAEEDEYLLYLCQVAAESIEHYIGCTLLKCTWHFLWNRPPRSDDNIEIRLPYPPIIQVKSIYTMQKGGRERELA